jgi:predicted nucleotidyltransferase
MENARQAHPLLPQGTRVVTRVGARCFHGAGNRPAGAVGVVFQSPTDASHAYLVRFVDGTEAALRRDELSILKQHYGEEMDAAAASEDEMEQLRPFIIYSCIVGSRAYGLDDESSDTDRRGIYLPPADLQWSLFGAPEQLEDHANQECYWELQKFLIMALKANPNILECLHTPLVERADALAEELLSMRGVFLSKLIYKTYNGYVLSQFKKLEQDLRTKGEIKQKHAMHLIRLLRSGIIAVETGELVVRVPEDVRRELLAIKHGEFTWDETNQLRLDLHTRFDAAFAKTALPDRPDYTAANAFLLRARRTRL